jgi:cytidyltransferase-like protein
MVTRARNASSLDLEVLWLRTVMAFGSFDGLHHGHIQYLKWAKKHGKKLVVVVSRDSSFKKWKRRKPYFSEKERLAVVRELGFVDEARLGGRKSFMDVIFTVKPTVIVLGYDHEIGEKELEGKLRGKGLRTRVVRCKAFRPKKLKSRKLKKKKPAFHKRT